MADDGTRINFRIAVPASLEAGTYSNACSVWWTPHDFVLDFGVTGRPEQDEAAVTVPFDIVSRIRIPTAMAQDLLTAIVTEVAKYEAAAGPIRRPNEDAPLFPPEELE